MYLHIIYSHDYYKIVINMVSYLYLYQWNAHHVSFLTYIEDKLTHLFTPQPLKLEFGNQIGSYNHFLLKLGLSSGPINHNGQFEVWNSSCRHVSRKLRLLNLPHLTLFYIFVRNYFLQFIFLTFWLCSDFAFYLWLLLLPHNHRVVKTFYKLNFNMIRYRCFW